MSFETRILRGIEDGHGREDKEQLREYSYFIKRRRDEDMFWMNSYTSR